MDKIDHYSYHSDSAAVATTASLNLLESASFDRTSFKKTAQATAAFVDPALEVLPDHYLPPASLTDDAPRQEIKISGRETNRTQDLSAARVESIDLNAQKLLLRNREQLSSFRRPNQPYGALPRLESILGARRSFIEQRLSDLKNERP